MPVMWETQMSDLVASGLEKAYECGPGTVIAGVMKRIDKDSKNLGTIRLKDPLAVCLRKTLCIHKLLHFRLQLADFS
eukprot:5381052-Amphidinium_carterae.1